MSATVPSWTDIKAAWSSSWRALADRATTAYTAALHADPTGAANRIQTFVTALQQSRASLDRIGPRLPNPPATDADRTLALRYPVLEKRWNDLAAGFFADATPTPNTPALGVAPALVVGGLMITAVGLAWAFTAYEYAVNLQEQTALAERELDARIAASQGGRTLPPSTLPPQPSVVDGARSMGWWLFGGLALAAGVLAVPLLLERR